MSKKDTGVFGDPSYLVNKFDDVDKVVVSEKSAMAKMPGTCDGKPRKSYVAHIAMGLNGAWIDRVDDLVDVRVECADAADKPKKEPAK